VYDKDIDHIILFPPPAIYNAAAGVAEVTDKVALDNEEVNTFHIEEPVSG